VQQAGSREPLAETTGRGSCIIQVAYASDRHKWHMQLADSSGEASGIDNWPTQFGEDKWPIQVA
jgi:hypothetical protein